MDKIELLRKLYSMLCGDLNGKEIKKNREYMYTYGLPCWLGGEESACQCRRWRLDPCVGKVPWRKRMTYHSSILAWRISQIEKFGRL